jgi:CTP synthase (UTP-ammonia lyase)
MVIDYARNVLGWADAQREEYAPNASRLVISKLACSLAGREMQLKFVAGSRVAELYGAVTATERYYCNFGLNPEYVDLIVKGKFRGGGVDSEGEIRVMELSGHRFFVGTLYVPQVRSTPDFPHPLVVGFLQASNG